LDSKVLYLKIRGQVKRGLGKVIRVADGLPGMFEPLIKPAPECLNQGTLQGQAPANRRGSPRGGCMPGRSRANPARKKLFPLPA